ncbi:hypothetical protein WA026_009720 [Henosepilachna vigintioctopunctata]|uniref:Uncharacterized protein n=1 Tax=Henosepilachna vigintioctopunctata TaxID=420089 RepID=A0AAW1TQZ4_9CUCU
MCVSFRSKVRPSSCAVFNCRQGCNSPFRSSLCYVCCGWNYGYRKMSGSSSCFRLCCPSRSISYCRQCCNSPFRGFLICVPCCWNCSYRTMSGSLGCGCWQWCGHSCGVSDFSNRPCISSCTFV